MDSKMTSKIEFAVKMTCDKCVKAVRDKLVGVKGINDVIVSLENETVIVDTTLPAHEVQSLIQSSGRQAVVRGFGYGKLGAAVAMVTGENPVKGVIRFHQMDKGTCVIDGTLDGLSPGHHGLHVHECGDISQGCLSIGDHFNPKNTVHGSPSNEPDARHVGDLGNIVADETGRASFRIVDKVLKVDDIIGRSIAVTENEDDLGRGDQKQSQVDGNSGARLACGIIARSAGLFQNSKRFCACDGNTLWDESADPPGSKRASESAHL